MNTSHIISKMKLITLIVFISTFYNPIFAQDNVGIGTTTPDGSAVLHLESTDKGFLVPRMTTVQRDAISSPANGLIIFNTTTESFEYYSTTATPVGWYTIVTTTGVSFDLLTGGTNQNETLKVGDDSILEPTGTGDIIANIFRGTGSTTDNVDLATTEVNGTLPIANGGTNSSTYTQDEFLIYNGTSIVASGFDENDFTLSSLTDGYIFVGNASGVATGVEVDGDINIDNTGNTTIQPDAVETAMIINNAVNGTKIDLTGNANGDLMYYNGTDWVRLAPGTSGQVLRTNGVGSAPDWLTLSNGTVTSVDLDMPGIFNVTGNPITTSGTFDVTLNNQNQNLVFASPDGANGQPAFRALVANDIPNIDAAKITTGTLSINRGGTGVSTLPTDGQLLIGNSATSDFSLATLTEGSNITITNGNGTIEISANASGLDNGSADNTLRWDDTNTDWEESNFLRNTTSEIAIGDGGFTPTEFIHSDAGDATAHYHKFTAGTTTGQTASDGFNIGIDASGNALINQNEDLNLIFNTNATERMRLQNDGKLLIGTTTNPNDSIRVRIGDGDSDDDLLVDGDLIVTGSIDPTHIFMVPQSSAPVDVTEGAFYYDQNDKSMKFYDGTAWGDISGKVGSVLNLDDEAEIRFYEAAGDGTNYTAFKAQTQGGNVTYTLPAADGNNGDVLSTDGAGTLSWVAAGGGGGGNTLDAAYDQGGAGAGRTITADAGAVEISNAASNNNAVLVLNNNHATANSLEITTSTNINVTVDEAGNIDAGGDVTVSGNLTVGSDGSAIGEIIKATVSLSANVTMNEGTSTKRTFAVTGAESGSTVFVSPASSLNDEIVIAFAFVSNSDEITISFANIHNSQSRSIASGTQFHVTIIK